MYIYYILSFRNMVFGRKVGGLAPMKILEIFFDIFTDVKSNYDKYFCPNHELHCG